MAKDDFDFKFTKELGAKPFVGSVIRIPDFRNQEANLGAHDFKIWGDASNVDLSNAGDLLKYIRFDSNTVFPSNDKMPKGFNPTKVLEDGKNPGLHVRDLHKLGITGKGIIVAIIDQTLNTEHAEIKDNIIHYESIGYPEDEETSMHGMAVSSLLAGKTLGVAPDAKIVYFAAPFSTTPVYVGEQPIKNGDTDLYVFNHVQALRKTLFMNDRLPKDKKISAVSISSGILGESGECTKLINQLIESGVMVLTCDSYRFYGDNAKCFTIDKEMNSDADDIESYNAGFWRNDLKWAKDRLLAPSGGRTTAGIYTNDDYIYYGANGGMSWSTPYLVGVYALAKQVMPNLTPQHFFDVARQVGVSNGKVGDNIIIQPQKMIEYLQNEKILQQQNLEAKNR